MSLNGYICLAISNCTANSNTINLLNSFLYLVTLKPLMNKRRLHIQISFLAYLLFFLGYYSHAQNIELMMDKLEVSCPGMEDGRAIVVPMGGIQPYTYLWSTGSSEQVINDLGPGTYEVTVTDASGSTANSAIGLLDYEPMSVYINKEDGACGKLGTASVTILGGIGPFQFDWSNGAYTREITNLEEGTYTVTVTDRDACDMIESVDVVVYGDGIKLEEDFDTPSCAGNSNGYISVSQTGGQMPIQYTWSNGETGTSIDDLPAGTYSVFVEDALGCTDGIVIILQDPEELKVEVVNQNDALYARVDGGTPGYSYTWSNGVSGTTVINNLSPGEYGLTVEDAEGCITNGIGEIFAPLSNQEVEEVQRFEIFPTVVTQNFNLDLQIVKSEEISIEILSQSGEILWQRTSRIDAMFETIQLPSKWSSGLYIVHLQGESGWAVSKKFIKI